MGIPFYFRKVATKFPHVLSASPGATPRFFIDFNGIIHTCSAALKADVAIRREDFESALLDKICETVALLLGIVKPSFLFMSIDGMPSMAKIQQQRRRRYCSALDAPINSVWDSNAISPGTPFMERLATRLREWAKTIKNMAIVLSDSQEPGEGEHKIIQYIRQNPSTKPDMLYGLDADLIMLAVLESTPIYIMRETQLPKKKGAVSAHVTPITYTYIDVALFRTLLRTHLETFDMRGPLAIHIYVFMCFFIGNDFIPSLSYLKLQDDGLEVILQAYRITKTAIDEEPITADDFSINYHFLWRWMEVLQKNEDTAFIEAHASYVETQRPNIMKTLPPGTANRYLDTPKISVNAWRIDYYHYLFDSSADSPCIHRACTQYMEGLQWLVDLYFNQKIHAPGWYYYYAYSPSILDLYNYLTTQMVHLPSAHTARLLKARYAHNEIPAGDTDALLLAILPPVSIIQCIPQLAAVMKEPALGVAHLFPRSFKLQSYLRRHAWESYPQLPLLDIPALLKAKQKVTSVK